MKIAGPVLLLGVAAGIGAVLIRMTGAGRASGRVQHSTDRRSRPRLQGPATDLNIADAEDLRKLGLDGMAVDRIIENRPYRNKLELVSRMIIPKKMYSAIRHRVCVRHTSEPVKVA